MSVPYYGDFAEDDTVNIPFNTFSSDDPSKSCTITELADADIKVYKDGADTEIVTDGASVLINFDGHTGAHLITIDTSVHSDYATGSEYAVLIDGTVIDGATDMDMWIGTFSIERAGGALARLETLITTVGALGAGLTAITDNTDNIPASPAPANEYDTQLDANMSTRAPANEYDTQLDANMSTRAPASEYDTEMARITGNVALASGVDLTSIHGSALTETVGGYLAAAFVKLFDVATPVLVASDVMRGTDSANTTVPDAAGTAPTAVEIREEIDSNSTRLDADITSRAPAATALSDAVWTNAKAAFLDHSISTVDTVADGIQTDLSNATDGLGALKALIDGLNDITAANVKTAIEAGGSHLALIKAVTDALTTAAATKIALSAGTMVAGTVSHDNTAASTTVFYSNDITEDTADHYKGRIVIFTSGDLQYQATDITAYALDTGEGKFTVTALTEAPADNVTFIIV